MRRDPTQRVEATTTPEGGEGWETEQARHDDSARGHGVDVAPEPHPEGVRAETRRADGGDRGEPGNAPTAAYVPQKEAPVGKLIRATGVLRGSGTARLRGSARAEYAALREVERLLRRHENVLLDPEVPDALERLDRVRESAS